MSYLLYYQTIIYYCWRDNNNRI